MPRRPKRWRGASKSWPLVTLRIPRGIKLPVFSKMNVTMVMLASTTGLAPTKIMYHRPPDGLIADPGLRDFVAICRRHHALRRQAKRKGRPGWMRRNYHRNGVSTSYIIDKRANPRLPR